MVNTPPGHPDFAAFVVIIAFAFRSTSQFPGDRTNLLPRVLRTVVQDATLYFGFMLTSQLVLVLFQMFARVRCQLRPSEVLTLIGVIEGWSEKNPRTVS